VSNSSEPDLSPEPGWEQITTPTPYDARRSYVSGEIDGQRLRVRYFRVGDTGMVVGKAWFGPGVEWPPGHAHGGSMAALMDEVMGGCAWMNGHPVLAARLTVNFRAVLPMGTVAWFQARITRRRGRKIFVSGEITSAGGAAIFADATGLFIEVKPEALGAHAEGARALFERVR